MQREYYRVISWYEHQLITIVDDEPDILELVSIHMLPDIDGLQICKYMRGNDQFAWVPIIMLTAKAEEIDKVIGLELGADDYVTKPFSPRELDASLSACRSPPL